MRQLTNLPMKRCHQSIWTHDDRAFGELIIILLHPLQVVSRRVRLTDGTRSEVHNLVPIPSDVSVQLCHTEMRPVPAYHSEYMSKTIGSTRTVSGHNTESETRKSGALGYCPIDIRNNNKVR